MHKAEANNCKHFQWCATVHEASLKLLCYMRQVHLWNEVFEAGLKVFFEAGLKVLLAASCSARHATSC
jgi:hypothetical protein